MPLQFAAADTTYDTVRDIVRGLAAGKEIALDSLAGADPEQLNLTDQMQVWTLSVTQLRAKAPLSSAELRGWRYIVLNAQDPAAAAEATYQSNVNSFVYSSLNEGPFVLGTTTAVAACQQALQGDPDIYEARLLRISALFFMALWLKNSSTPGKDSLAPIAPAPFGLVPNKLYDPRSTLSTLYAVAG
jgi:hypothetical protein